jgi:hypothetical protein
VTAIVRRASSLAAHTVFSSWASARKAAGDLGFDVVLDTAGAQATRGMAVEPDQPKMFLADAGREA